jgi:hypothetical protein
MICIKRGERSMGHHAPPNGASVSVSRRLSPLAWAAFLSLGPTAKDSAVTERV